MSVEYFEEQRRHMVAVIRAHIDQVAAQIGKTALDKRVLRALDQGPSARVCAGRGSAVRLLTGPLPIGFDKTISQPLMVAVMTDLLELKPHDVDLEIGTGLGHQPQSSPR
jgi:protein-L-isoaspartate(D-aspartate) O-methyltransferase